MGKAPLRNTYGLCVGQLSHHCHGTPEISKLRGEKHCFSSQFGSPTEEWCNRYSTHGCQATWRQDLPTVTYFLHLGSTSWSLHYLPKQGCSLGAKHTMHGVGECISESKHWPLLEIQRKGNAGVPTASSGVRVCG